MLHSSPSFSIFYKNDGLEDEGHNGTDVGREEELMRTITIRENIESIGSGDFSFGETSMGLIEEEGEKEQEQDSNGIENFDIEEVREPASPPLYLAAGLGIDDIDLGGDSGGGGGFHLSFPNFDEDDDSKGDLHGAEEYYRLATLAAPADGEILMQYAKLEWELNHDQDRALINFERAVQSAPQDSYVLAAYASFLWETEENEEESMSQFEMPNHNEVGSGRSGKHNRHEREENLRLPSDCNSKINYCFLPFLGAISIDHLFSNLHLFHPPSYDFLPSAKLTRNARPSSS
ncbi:hypothetical protein D5086_016944 [Populus alba]|uniref:Uncharacterized protein n=1 Tax=Populus alba TaxID=43335 RepID=A0ACC4BVK3_POPAL